MERATAEVMKLTKESTLVKVKEALEEGLGLITSRRKNDKNIRSVRAQMELGGQIQR